MTSTTSMGEWECGNCGWIADGPAAPSVCAECGAAASRFVFYPYIDDSGWDDEVEPREVDIPNEEYDDPP